MRSLLCLLALIVPAKAQLLEKMDNQEAPLIINAEQSVICDEDAGKCVATGLAKAQKGTSFVTGNILTVYFTQHHEITSVTAEGNPVLEIPDRGERIQADHLVAYFTPTKHDAKKTEIERAEATGHVIATNPKSIITGNHGIYFGREKRVEMRGNALAEMPEDKELVQAEFLTAYFEPAGKDSEKMTLIRVEGEGNVLASNPKSVVTGNRGTYYAQEERVEMFENVRITQDENIIQGQYGRANLKTNVVEIFPDLPKDGKICTKGKRISGVIIPRSAKGLKHSQGKGGNLKSSIQPNVQQKPESH